MAMKPTPEPKFKKAIRNPNRGKDPIQKGLEFFFGGKAPKPTAKPKVKIPLRPGTISNMPRVKPGGSLGKPAPMPKRTPGGSLGTPVPMPKRTPAGPKGKREMPYTGPRRERNPKLKPAGPKVKSPGTATPKPKAKKPTLDDFLKQGKRPPIKLKPGLKRPRGL